MKHDLGIGEPRFLSDVKTFLTDRHYKDIANRGYPTKGGEPELIDALSVFPGKYKVVCNGAKQALYAAIASVASADTSAVQTTSVPYWNYLPAIVKRSGLVLVGPKNEIPVSNIILNTSPNNPDGEISDKECDVWDAAYAHEVYGFDADEHDIKNKVYVRSASKLYGLSNDRIGWLGTDDPEIAKEAATYVEQTTSGVSGMAQQVLLNVLINLTTPRNNEEIQDLYFEARERLISNAKTVFNAMNAILFTGNFIGAATESFVMPKGMFAWAYPRDGKRFQRALEDAEIKTLPGAIFGVEGWHRISLGCHQLQMEAAMEDFSRAYRDA